MSVCPHPTCSTSIEFDRFACRPHWFSLPTSLRNDILREWRGVLSSRDGAIERHAEAKERALDFWGRGQQTIEPEQPYGLRIDPDGSTTLIHDRDVARIAHEAFGGLSTVVTLRSPFTPEPDVFVGWVADWGRVNLEPLNVKAWALYGRSPIVGPMFVALDMDDDGSRQQLEAEFVTLVAGSEWVTLEIQENMRRMLATLNDGYPIPEWNWTAS